MYKKNPNSRLENLSTEVTEILLDTKKRSNLGRIALEILIERERIENVLEEDGDAELKQQAKTDLKRLRELEKSVVHFYFISMMSGKSPQNHFIHHVMGKYRNPGVVR